MIFEFQIKFEVLFIIVAFCRDLPRINNGVLDYNNMMESLLNDTRPNGTVATYTCDDGFRLDGNATSYRYVTLEIGRPQNLFA